MSTPIKKILQQLIGAPDNWQLKLLANWEVIVGSIKTKVNLLKIADDTLILGVMDSCWMQELHLLSPLLIKKINENLDRPRIKHLRFKSIGLKKEKKEPFVMEKKIIKPVRLSSNEQQRLAEIKDPQLRQLLQDYLIRCYQER